MNQVKQLGFNMIRAQYLDVEPEVTPLYPQSELIAPTEQPETIELGQTPEFLGQQLPTADGLLGAVENKLAQIDIPAVEPNDAAILNSLQAEVDILSSPVSNALLHPDTAVKLIGSIQATLRTMTANLIRFESRLSGVESQSRSLCDMEHTLLTDVDKLETDLSRTLRWKEYPTPTICKAVLEAVQVSHSHLFTFLVCWIGKVENSVQHHRPTVSDSNY